MTTQAKSMSFKSSLVRFILDGQKTQTRRIAKHPLAKAAVRINSYKGQSEFDCILADGTGGIIQCPYGAPGDQLWVKEEWGLFSDLGFSDTSWAGIDELPDGWSLAYRADHVDPVNGDGPHIPYWRPSVCMPRWASRITLEITGVRAERLQKIFVWVIEFKLLEVKRP